MTDSKISLTASYRFYRYGMNLVTEKRHKSPKTGKFSWSIKGYYSDLRSLLNSLPKSAKSRTISSLQEVVRELDEAVEQLAPMSAILDELVFNKKTPLEGAREVIKKC